MGTTAQKLEAVLSSKVAIKEAIEAKGVQNVGDVLSEYAYKIGEIPTGSGTKYGISLDNLYGNIDGNGMYTATTEVPYGFHGDGILSIGASGFNKGFQGNNNLSSATFPDLTSCGRYSFQDAFRNCQNFKSFSAPNHVRNSGSNVYASAFISTQVSALELPSLSATNNYCFSGAFMNSPYIKTVNLSALVNIGTYAFQYAFYKSGFTGTFNLPLARSFQTYSFYCAFTNTGITEFTTQQELPSGAANTVIDSRAFYQAFYGCTSLKTVSIPVPNQVASYGLNGAFYGCTSLEVVDLSHIQTVGSYGLNNAFTGCTSLKAVIFKDAVAVPTLTNVNAFSNTNDTYKIVVPNRLYDTWRTSGNWANSSIQPHIIPVSAYVP